MTKKAETLSYISKLSREAVMDEIAKHNTKLDQIRKCLAERAEGYEEAKVYQQKGASWRRKEVLAECELDQLPRLPTRGLSTESLCKLRQ